MSTTHWLIIQPMDTLFFRGSEPMEAGENHQVDTMFPPVPSTIIGAIRTAVLGQNNIAPTNLDSWQDYPILGTLQIPGFQLIGPLFMVAGEPLLPVPATWYGSLDDDFDGKEYRVQNSTPLNMAAYGFRGSVKKPFWVQEPKGEDMKSLNGYWATGQCFKAVQQEKAIVFRKDPKQIKPGQAAIVPASALCDREHRVGIALTNQRAAKEGHLFSTVHIRLKPDVQIVAGINSNHDLGLAPEGIIQLGGEQRVCSYQLTDEMKLPEETMGNAYLALSPVSLDNLPTELAQCPRASGKLQRFGGWDMQKKFHKPMSAWLPAGTVFQATDVSLSKQYLAI